MSTQPLKSFFNKTNTTLPNSDKNTPKSKSLQLNFTWTIWEERLTSHDQVFIPQKRVKESKELHSSHFWVLDVFTASVCLQYGTQILHHSMSENCPITHKAPGNLRHCTKVSFPPSNSQPLNVTEAGPCSYSIFTKTSVLHLLQSYFYSLLVYSSWPCMPLGIFFMTLSAHSSGQCAGIPHYTPENLGMCT